MLLRDFSSCVVILLHTAKCTWCDLLLRVVNNSVFFTLFMGVGGWVDFIPAGQSVEVICLQGEVTAVLNDCATYVLACSRYDLSFFWFCLCFNVAATVPPSTPPPSPQKRKKNLAVQARTESSVFTNIFHMGKKSSIIFPYGEHHQHLDYGYSWNRRTLLSVTHSSLCCDRLVGLVVKASALGAEDPEFESRLRLDISSGLKTGTPVATLTGTWHYRVGTGRCGESLLWLGEVESWICNFYLSVAARKLVWADPSQSYTSMLLGH